MERGGDSTLSLATLGLAGSIVPFSGLAAVMTAFQLTLLYLFLPRTAEPSRPRLSRALVIAYLLPATAIMWAVLPGAVLRPTYDTWWAAVQAMMVPMPAPFLWFMSQVYRAEERPIDRTGLGWPIVLSAAVIGNEALMGYAFAALAGAPGLTDPLTAFSLGVNSPWFAASMISTMAALIVWIPASSWARVVLAGLAASSLAGPLWLLDPLTCSVAMSVLMAGTAAALVYGLLGGPSRDAGTLWFVYGAAAALAAMTFAGLASAAFPAWGATGWPFAAAGVAVMMGETAYLLRKGLRAIPDPTPSTLPLPAEVGAVS